MNDISRICFLFQLEEKARKAMEEKQREYHKHREEARKREELRRKELQQQQIMEASKHQQPQKRKKGKHKEEKKNESNVQSQSREIEVKAGSHHSHMSHRSTPNKTHIAQNTTNQKVQPRPEVEMICNGSNVHSQSKSREPSAHHQVCSHEANASQNGLGRKNVGSPVRPVSASGQSKHSSPRQERNRKNKVQEQHSSKSAKANNNNNVQSGSEAHSACKHVPQQSNLKSSLPSKNTSGSLCANQNSRMGNEQNVAPHPKDLENASSVQKTNRPAGGQSEKSLVSQPSQHPQPPQQVQQSQPQQSKKKGKKNGPTQSQALSQQPINSISPSSSHPSPSPGRKNAQQDHVQMMSTSTHPKQPAQALKGPALDLQRMVNGGMPSAEKLAHGKELTSDKKSNKHNSPRTDDKSPKTNEQVRFIFLLYT